MNDPRRVSSCVIAFWTAACVCAQTTPEAPAGPRPARPEFWAVGPFQFGGVLDGYYSFGLNEPASRVNLLRNFDLRSNRLSLNMAKLTVEHTPDPIGFRADVGFGPAFDLAHAAGTAPAAFHRIEQIYAAWKPQWARGIQVDFGKFVTSAGAETIETHANWNYSRSLLFAWGLPYYHFGLRSLFPVNGHFTLGAQLVDGWNHIGGLGSGKTIGLTAALATPRLAWNHTYYTGPEGTGANRGRRQLYDTALLLTPSAKLGCYLNFDYGVQNTAAGGDKHWLGVAGATRFAFTERFALATRLEWFNDAGGFSTGTVQKVKEATLTAEFKIRPGVLSRLEYRRDWSNVPFFTRGSFAPAWKNQDTLLAGLVAFFGPKR